MENRGLALSLAIFTLQCSEDLAARTMSLSRSSMEPYEKSKKKKKEREIQSWKFWNGKANTFIFAIPYTEDI